MRPLLRAMVVAAIVVAGADLLLLVLRHLPGSSLPTLFADGYFSVATSAVLLAIMLLLQLELPDARNPAPPAQFASDPFFNGARNGW